jgi:hypothetical protein
MQRARTRLYETTTCFYESTKTVNEVQNESVIEQVRKRVMIGDDTNSNINAADSHGSAAIQLKCCEAETWRTKAAGDWQLRDHC